MTKKQRALILATVCLVAVLIAYFLNQKDLPIVGKTTSPVIKTQSPLPIIKREVASSQVTLPKNKASLPANIPSETWKVEVEKTLRQQGGNSLKSVSIDKVDSFVMNYEGIPLNVEAVAINLTNQNGEVTKFNAVVDSQNGKILRTFDLPIIDPVNPRAVPGIKIDPRYHSEN